MMRSCRVRNAFPNPTAETTRTARRALATILLCTVFVILRLMACLQNCVQGTDLARSTHETTPRPGKPSVMHPASHAIGRDVRLLL